MNRRRDPGVARALALAGLLVLVPGGIAEPQDPADSGFRVAVHVDLVELYATVLDRQGRPVVDLRQEHFSIYEDGVQQTIRVFQREDVPVAVGLVIDHSGSVGRKMDDVIAAARLFVQHSSPDDQIFVVNFNENVTLGLPAGMPFTNRADELERAISATPATGMTALHDAVYEARLQLPNTTRDKKVLLVVSDGSDNASKHNFPEVLRLAEQSSALIYTIGIFDPGDPDGNPGVLRRLARSTGGEAFFPRRLSELAAICEGIAREIRSQYTLGFISSREAKPGAYRNIRVTAKAAGYDNLTVRARSGYVAAAEAAK